MLQVLRPELVWIEGRCYRVNDCSAEISSFPEHDLYEMDVADEIDEECDSGDEHDVLELDTGRFTSQLHVPKHYIGSVIGKKGVTKMRIEKDTLTEIKIPRHGQGGDIAIFGNTVSNVRRAISRIEMVVESSRKRQRPTHFLSIPLNDPAIMDSFNQFKETVLSECQGRDIEEALFICPHKLHLTIGVMCLMDNEERTKAADALSEAKEKIIIPMLENKLPLKLRVKGLSYMNDDPSDIPVLYGCIQDVGDSGLVQQLSDALYHFFIKKGLMFKDHDRDFVLLHMTLMNKRYRHKEDAQDIRKFKHKSFDGTKILENLADWDFGTVELKEIHLSQMHCEVSGQYYNFTSVITI